MKPHIIWDWNGTLLNDFSVSLNATNEALSEINIPKITSLCYKENYSVPVDDFYHKIIGRTTTRDEWKRIGQKFNEIYKPEVIKAPLADKAMHILKNVKSQSICSLMENDLLLSMVESFGVRDYFSLIQGRSHPLLKEGKEKHLEAHINWLVSRLNIDKRVMILIGDTVDDAYSAKTAGIKSILYSGGTYSYDRLKATGQPVAKTLDEAIVLAESTILRSSYV